MYNRGSTSIEKWPQEKADNKPAEAKQTPVPKS